MRVIVKLSIHFFVLLLIISSCTKEHPAPAYVSDYFPLNIGDTWNYQSQKLEIKSLKTINSKAYYEVLISQYNAGVLFGTNYAYYRKTTYGKVYKLNNDLNSESLLYDFTVPVNHSWTYKEGDMEWQVTNSTESKVVNINHSIIANCRQFDFDIVKAVDDEHAVILAPGIGKIISFSYAWGMNDTLKSAVINGVDYSFK